MNIKVINKETDEEIEVDLSEYSYDDFVEKYPESDYIFVAYLPDIGETVGIAPVFFDMSKLGKEDQKAVVMFAKMKKCDIRELDCQEVFDTFHGHFLNKSDFVSYFIDSYYSGADFDTSLILNNLDKDGFISDLEADFSFHFEGEDVYVFSK